MGDEYYPVKMLYLCNAIIFILSVAIKYSFADDIQSVKFHLRCAYEFILKENYGRCWKGIPGGLRLDPTA